jgi:hypothetical protein
VFRVFNWVSYVIFSVVILSRRPSAYIAIHTFFLVVILICDTMRTSSSMDNRKTKLLRVLWIINFYVTIIMIFTRYFYFLKQYGSNSQFMDYLLEVLTKYKFWIGLDELTVSTEGFALGKYFLYDATVVLLSWINIYIYDFKIYYATQQTTNAEQ